MYRGDVFWNDKSSNEWGTSQKTTKPKWLKPNIFVERFRFGGDGGGGRGGRFPWNFHSQPPPGKGKPKKQKITCLQQLLIFLSYTVSLFLPFVLFLSKENFVRGQKFMFSFQTNRHLLKKMKKGTEAANILVGELEGLEKPICCFIRLEEAVNLGDLTEVPLATRLVSFSHFSCTVQGGTLAFRQIWQNLYFGLF